MPAISIITAAYNAAATLADCLESVAGQGVDAEHLLIDGGSGDGTLAVVERYRRSLAYVVSEPDRGMYNAMNKGLRRAAGDIVGILNADDFYPNAAVLPKVLEAFSDPAVEACYGDLVYVDGKDPRKVVRYWRAGDCRPGKFYWGWMPPHPAFFVRRSVYEKYGAFDPALGTAADYEIMLRFLLKRRIEAVYLPTVLVHMRTGGVSNASWANRLKANRMDRKAWEVNGLRPYPWTLWAKPLRKLGQWVVRP
ncbi:MAG: glycosyltransferase family 2 protein [Gammaproteobacteria bacterium]